MAELILRGTLITGSLQLVGDFGHLQLVNSFDNMEIEINAGLAGQEPTDPNVFWDVRPIETAEIYNEGDVQDTVIDIGDREFSDVWAILSQILDQFSGKSILYTPYQNSNSYINSLLYMIGIDIDAESYISRAKPDTVNGPSLLPPPITTNPLVLAYYSALETLDDPYFPGYTKNGVVEGWNDLGTGATLVFGFALETTAGNDILNTGRGDDTIFGSAGFDALDAGDHGTDEGSGDTLTYEKLTTGVHLFVGTPGTPTTYHIADIEAGANPLWEDQAKNFETYILTPTADLFELSNLPSDIYDITFDGGDNTGAHEFVIQHYLNANNTLDTILAYQDILSLEGLATYLHALRPMRPHLHERHLHRLDRHLLVMSP